VSSPLQRVAIYFGVAKPDPDAPAPRDERSLLQVMIGNLLFAFVAAGVTKLLGSDVVEAVMFGVIIYIMFLWFDLRARRKQREADGG
jgi:Flp pilus assembly protein TadB